MPPGARLRALNKDVVAELAKSMAELGMLNPLTVKEHPYGGYELVCGG
jgi:ParB-like chromosome segregation protein Spo0J